MSSTPPGAASNGAHRRDPDEEETWPFGFMILVALAALYVGYRIVQVVYRLVT